METNSSLNGYPTQPPKKRKSGTDFDERDIKSDFNNLNTRLNASTPPKSSNSLSQDSPLDFSVKNGSDYPPTVISPPSTITPPSARSSPSVMFPPTAVSPMSSHFPASDLNMARKDLCASDPDYSDSRQAQENMNSPRPKISIVNPTIHMHTEEDTNGSRDNRVANSPISKFTHCSQHSYDRPVIAGNYENGFGKISNEYSTHKKNYENVVNGFNRSISTDSLCSPNMTTFNPYLGMLPTTFGGGLMSGHGGILTPQGGLLNNQAGLLNGQGSLLNGHGGLLTAQGGFLNGQAGLLNNQTFKYGAVDTNGDRKPSKSARPFKIYEHEILNYPYQNCSSLIPNRFQEMSQTATTVYNTIDSSRNESPPRQHSNSNSRQSNGESQRDVSDEYSDESQHSNNPNQSFDGNGSRRKGQKYPDEKKDAAYFEKRRKNNLAAKRSRDARRQKEDAIATRARNLVQENTLLKMRLAEFQAVNMRLDSELNGFKRAAYDQRREIDKLKDEVQRLNRGFAYNKGSRNCERSESPSL